MDFQLVITRGRSTNQVLRLAEGVTTVGRQADCQLRIVSSQVSRRHCQLFEKGGQFLVKDLGSSNGTFVNGKKIQGQQVLEPGDELMVGQVTLRVAKVGVSPPVKPAVGSGPSAADTAVVEAVSVADPDDEEFEIDFDDEPIPVASVEPAVPEPPRASEAKPAAEPKKEKEKAKEPAAAGADPNLAGEAIADFLLDIKLDDEE